MIAPTHQHLERLGRDDPFAELVLAVASDPDNPYNVERYLWVLEEPAMQVCRCGQSFDPEGGLGGRYRRYCSDRCQQRAWSEQRKARIR